MVGNKFSHVYQYVDQNIVKSIRCVHKILKCCHREKKIESGKVQMHENLVKNVEE